MTWLFHPSGLIIIPMTEPLSTKGTGYPVINLLVMCVPISKKTNKDANNSHIEMLSISTTLTIVGNPFSRQP